MLAVNKGVCVVSLRRSAREKVWAFLNFWQVKNRKQKLKFTAIFIG
jgi:hypothetical protein